MIRITDRESSKTFLIPADHEGCLSFSTLKQYFAGATGLVYLADNRKDEIAVLGYNGNESFKEEYFSKLQKKISTKEKKLKFKASRTVMEFVDYKDETFLTKVEYYNWQHDICIMRSLKVLHHATPRTEYCERGTNYIMLGFRPPEYSHCIIDGIVSGSMNGRYLCGAPGAFPGMSGGPVLQKFANGRGRLLGICSGAKDAQIGIHSSFGEALNALSDAQTNLPYVLIVPAFQLLFGLPEKTKSYE
ncbi:hypothetical protein FO519_009911, partial [Halicephalobus sp. NKZ332]